MATYLYNLPQSIRPFVSGEYQVTRPFKATPHEVIIHCKRKDVEIPLEVKDVLLSAGFYVSEGMISFQRHQRSFLWD